MVLNQSKPLGFASQKMVLNQSKPLGFGKKVKGGRPLGASRGGSQDPYFSRDGEQARLSITPLRGGHWRPKSGSLAPYKQV